ncbi:MAG: hypothetical protein LBP22_13990 [Deltaproteobacteria bacterium]|jgi:hypothetical protein|nr:hypothetical protein [Deltaproteobacteria bacterium]
MSGFKSLISPIKNIPNKSEQWKTPIKEWLMNIEEKRLHKSEQKKKRKEKEALNAASG